MTAAPIIDFEPMLSPEILEAETDLVAWMNYCRRLHTSRISHDPTCCIVCFSGR